MSRRHQHAPDFFEHSKAIRWSYIVNPIKAVHHEIKSVIGEKRKIPGISDQEASAFILANPFAAIVNHLWGIINSNVLFY